MGKLFYLMGKSSSGKDTIYKKLIDDASLNLGTIVLYTTRPIREGEQNGVEYYFVTKDRLQELIAKGKVIEHRCYHTCCGEWDYFTVDDENMDLNARNYLMIGTIESFLPMRDYYGRDTVIPLMIELDDGIRLQRALNRERRQEKPKYNELCRRFLADDVDFSEEKKKQAGIDKSFQNEDLNTCLSEIKSYIESF